MNIKHRRSNHVSGKRLGFRILLILILLNTIVMACSKGNPDPTIDPEINEPEENANPESNPVEFDKSKFYVPQEFKEMDFNDSSSDWCYERSKQSEHFIVFWAKGYGKNIPESTAIPEEYRVDTDDLLAKAEGFYDLNVNKLKFAEAGVGKSNLDKYKMMIFLFYQTDWMAFGAGYDDTIGALWINPGTVHPVGAVIAHEIGHSFQYQVFCDLRNGHGFRYGFGGNGGNAFWEQCAQWQAYQSYPDQVFGSSHFPVYCDNSHRHICHEDYRYASYFIHYYWAEKHGIDIIGKIWREAHEPEDPIQAYMRITGINTEQFNAEIYEAATKFVTWDLDALREIGANYIGKQTFKSTKLDDGAYQVSYGRCPGTTGYNVIPLNVPGAGTEISAQFAGMVNAEGYNNVADASRAGWRYGYVALLDNDTRVYGGMNTETNASVTFTVPSGCKKLWFVVTGAPNRYVPHPWDDDESNDDQWPYKVKFANTDILGNVTFDGTEIPADVTLTYDVKFPASSTAYSGSTVDVNITDLAKAFVLQSSEISSKIGDGISFFAVEPNGSLNATTTANGYGHWFDRDGNVCNWGDNAKVYSEFNATNLSFTIGQFPGHCTSGNQFRIKQALVYEYAAGKKVQATFVFNVSIE
ncbi:MAG: DUF4859 domain-containing protein [Bacteroidales bacterium]|nr:DUF4859 domain-containing protein [Bacteroidales bacterium]